jgi:hypothetical protein
MTEDKIHGQTVMSSLNILSAGKIDCGKMCDEVLLLMRPKARGLAHHGGPPGWLEESDPAGVILYCDGRAVLTALPYGLRYMLR